MIFREARLGDVADLVEVQAEGAIKALSHIFPQETHPFPRAELVARWTREIAAPDIHPYVGTDDVGGIIGFAATRDSELLHFGVALRSWGSGLARELHDAVLHALAETMRTGTASPEPASPGTTWVRLRVFEENHRARRFYEKLGWTETGRRTQTSFAPHPVLLEYHRTLR